MWPSTFPGFPYPILLLSAQAALPNKISCFVNTCVSSDDSFLSVRQEPTLSTHYFSFLLAKIIPGLEAALGIFPAKNVPGINVLFPLFYPN